MFTRIATWNVNSIRVRFDIVINWAQSTKSDVILLQETKCIDEKFPRLEFENLGWHLALRGQKTYNGVAIMSRQPIIEEICKIVGDNGEARYIEAKLQNGIRVISIYVPMGQSVESNHFVFKLKFLDAIRERVIHLLNMEEPFVLGGDYNVAPDERDVFDAEKMKDHILFHHEERKRFRSLLHLGLTDAFRASNNEIRRFSWWDYRANSWLRNRGLRIDHLLLSPQITDWLVVADIDDSPRSNKKCSDHAPVWCELNSNYY
ncbi:MAG: exodeoxyribonuclease III [Rhodospirillaceae bacterium]|jgi:exodeoxyribonuclease-3|nr:exodeoxyribonuclease III [Rhodospirillaceae bacterium]